MYLLANTQKDNQTTAGRQFLDALVHQRAGFHGGKTKFCQSENGANETGNGSHGGLSASALKPSEFHDHAQGFCLGCPSTPESGFSRR